MSAFQALIIGIVQGATEFLPISSSGHLMLVPFLVGWDEPTVAFTVAAHIGTLIAVVWAMRDRVEPLVRTALGWKRAAEDDRRIVIFILVGSIPAGFAGTVLGGLFERAFDRPVLTSLLLGVTAWILFAAENHSDQRALKHEDERTPLRTERELNARDALIIGTAQALAILPGVSRSGATIAAGIMRDVDRQTAARFSFLLSIPAIAGAALIQFPDMLSEGAAGGFGPFLIGIVASGVSGFIAVRWFLRLIRTRGLRPFAIYCTFAMVAGILTALARG